MNTGNNHDLDLLWYDGYEEMVAYQENQSFYERWGCDRHSVQGAMIEYGVDWAMF